MTHFFVYLNIRHGHRGLELRCLDEMEVQERLVVGQSGLIEDACRVLGTEGFPVFFILNNLAFRIRRSYYHILNYSCVCAIQELEQSTVHF